ncbi:MAG: hypothetical protein GY757_21045 [bacterium]|nr:hypothetical protein [bacterium]
MKIESKKNILKYVNINILAKDMCYFVPTRSKAERFTLNIITASTGGVIVQAEGKLSDLKGNIFFRSYNLLFNFACRLHAQQAENCYFAELPPEIIHEDRRKYPRIFFESHENKIIKVTSMKSQVAHKVILFNMSGGGMGFFLTHPDERIVLGESLFFETKLLGIDLKAFAKVKHAEGSLVGCEYMDIKLDFRARINKVVFKEIEWRSETHLLYLERKKQIVEKIKETEDKKELKKQKSINYLDFINPFLESAASVVNSFLGITLKKKDLRFEKVSTGLYDATTYFDCESKDFKFQFFLCLKEEVLLKTADIVFQEKHESLTGEVKDLLGELGNMIVGNAKTKMDSSHHYTLSTPGLIIGKKHVLSTLSQFPSIRIIFESEIGEFDVILFVSDIINKLKEETHKTIDLCSAENLEFIEPIYNSTINLFSNFLNLDIREKSITMRNPLVPKFEISALLGISNVDMEGKMVLNLSRKLALSIYEILLNEKIDEFSEEVKDAVGEILNMITGNAKKDFQKKNIYYHLSTPFIVEGKEQIIKNVGNHPFLSSIYWTSSGFFELCYTLYNRK